MPPSLLVNVQFQLSQLATPIVVSLVAACGTVKDVKYLYYLAVLLSDGNGREIRKKAQRGKGTRAQKHKCIRAKVHKSIKALNL